MSIKNLLISLLLALMLTTTGFTEEEPAKGEEFVPQDLLYFQVSPDIVTNYNKKGKKLGYIIVQVQLAVYGETQLEKLALHEPMIKDTIIMNLSVLDKKAVRDIQTRAMLSKKIKKELQKILEEEEGEPMVEDVLFTKYTWQ